MKEATEFSVKTLERIEQARIEGDYEEVMSALQNLPSTSGDQGAIARAFFVKCLYISYEVQIGKKKEASKHSLGNVAQSLAAHTAIWEQLKPYDFPTNLCYTQVGQVTGIKSLQITGALLATPLKLKQTK